MQLCDGRIFLQGLFCTLITSLSIIIYLDIYTPLLIIVYSSIWNNNNVNCSLLTGAFESCEIQALLIYRDFLSTIDFLVTKKILHAHLISSVLRLLYNNPLKSALHSDPKINGHSNLTKSCKRYEMRKERSYFLHQKYSYKLFWSNSRLEIENSAFPIEKGTLEIWKSHESLNLNTQNYS